MDVQVLARQGFSQRAIARQTGHGRNTIKRLLQEAGTEAAQRRYRPRASKLDPYKAYVHDRYTTTGLSAVRLYAEIGEQGYCGGLDTLRRYIRTLTPLETTYRKATIRYETAPGEQAQVDWAYCGRMSDGQGRMVPVYAFLLVLGFSRLLHVSLTTDMRVETLIHCHEEAFAAIGGSPKTILYDNMKQVRLTALTLNPLFVDFASHYEFVPKTHRVRRPRTKGKVERMVDYLKENFLRGRSFADLDEARAQLTHWLAHTANVRVHATTQQRPVDLWAVERPHLAPVAQRPAYRLATHAVRKVSSECWVHFEGSRYSVPPSQVGRSVLVEVQVDQRQVLIRADQVIIAAHPLALTRGSTLSDPAHLAALWEVTLAHATPPPPLGWDTSVTQSVEIRPLSVYEALVS